MNIKDALRISEEVAIAGGKPEELLRGKCNWEKMSRTYVIMNWGDPRLWKDVTAECPLVEKSEKWFTAFKGRCVACGNAVPSPKKKEMLCQCSKAWRFGLPSRPGGMEFDKPVSKLFGCVYYVR